MYARGVLYEDSGGKNCKSTPYAKITRHISDRHYKEKMAIVGMGHVKIYCGECSEIVVQEIEYLEGLLKKKEAKLKEIGGEEFRKLMKRKLMKRIGLVEVNGSKLMKDCE